MDYERLFKGLMDGVSESSERENGELTGA